MTQANYTVDSITPEQFRDMIIEHTRKTVGKNLQTLNSDDWCRATAFACRDLIAPLWLNSHAEVYHRDEKQVYYLSMEFLIGRSMSANLVNIGVYEICRKAFDLLGLDWKEVAFSEPEAGLGNGGLGRLAACLMDSLATVGIPAWGYGIRYDYGMFHQRIEDGCQVEYPDNWRRAGNAWEFVREKNIFEVMFGGRVISFRDASGRERFEWVDGERVVAVGRDQAITGYKSNTVNTIRLWKAESQKEFDLQRFNVGDYIDAMRGGIESQNISRILYPDDSTHSGKELRFKQEYFFVSASLQDILRRYLKEHPDLTKLPEKAAIQLNDTHPSIAIPELMRLLIDIYEIDWDTAWTICVNTFGYTNHTVMPEALESWPVEMFQRVLPRHYQIVCEINQRFLDSVRHKFPGDFDLIRRVSIFDETAGRRVRMAHLAFVGSHRVNGVARLHTELLHSGLFADLNRCLPGRIVNITNGIAPRRWVLLSNRNLTRVLTSHLGEEWKRDIDKLRALEPLADDTGFREEVAEAKLRNKERLAAFIRQTSGFVVDPRSLFDVQVKRIHEYKRQLLNVLHVVTLYNRIRQGRLLHVTPRTVIFGGKAAPAYKVAKSIIRLINNVADVVSNDPKTNGALKVAFIPNYNVAAAQIIIPGADLSEQISTAGTEASGTSNMKFALNGALTIGTRDGANIEMAEEIGDENMFLFGLSAAEANEMRFNHRQRGRQLIDGDDELREALDMIRNGWFSPTEPDRYTPLIDALLNHDEFLLLEDYRSYIEAQDMAAEVFRDQGSWTRKAILNVARVGFFSADRTVRNYGERVWDVVPRS